MTEAVHPHVGGIEAPRGREGARERGRRAAEPIQPGFRLGNIARVEIRVDWSLALVFWLIVLSLGSGLFPTLHPDWGPALSWTVALVAAVLFFGSILAHELAHALVGRAHGVPVEGITLFMFGGVARLSGEPRSPGAEFLMAIVGPLTSFAIGIVCTLAATALARMSPAAGGLVVAQLSPAATVLLWLGSTNLLLAMFNLLPGFPLDGGRVLRSILWKATGDVRTATRWASGVGRFIALLLIIAGITMMFGARFPILGGGLFQGLWLVLIGWFLNNAAINSYRTLVVTESLAGVPVARLMRAPARVVTPQTRVSDLVELFMRGDDHCFMVMEGDRFAGLVCMADVRKAQRDRWDVTPVRDIMTEAHELAVARPEESGADALRKLASLDVDQLPVVDDDGVLVGMLRRADLLRWLELFAEAESSRVQRRGGQLEQAT